MVQPWWAAQVGWNQNAVGEKSNSDSLDETDLAFWQGSETEGRIGGLRTCQIWANDIWILRKSQMNACV